MGERGSRAGGGRGGRGGGERGLPHCAPCLQEQQQREHEEAMRDRGRRSESIEKAAVSAGAERPVLPRVPPAVPQAVPQAEHPASRAVVPHGRAVAPLTGLHAGRRRLSWSPSARRTPGISSGNANARGPLLAPRCQHPPLAPGPVGAPMAGGDEARSGGVGQQWGSLPPWAGRAGC